MKRLQRNAETAAHSLVRLSMLCITLLVACDPKVKQCREEYLKNHALVSSVDTNDEQSVGPALSAVRANLKLCKEAELVEESEQLLKVERRLSSHFDFLKRAGQKKPLSKEELAALVKKGDPVCPRGQSYKYRKSGKTIRCKGPQLVDMSLKQASAYFEQQGFKTRRAEQTLFGESGSVSYRYQFSNAAQAASCLVVFGPPGIAWQETASRVTGVPASRLRRDKPVRLKGREVPLAVEEGKHQAKLTFGVCSE